jgi:hypothetical protein
MTLKFGMALIRLAAEDPAVHKLTLEVQHLLKPRSVYRDPDLVRRVFAKMAEAQRFRHRLIDRHGPQYGRLNHRNPVGSHAAIWFSARDFRSSPSFGHVPAPRKLSRRANS